MSQFPISRFAIRFKALNLIQLPPYAGSALRGAFGHALKNIACLSAGRNKGICCCQPVESCLYRRLFDPPRQQLRFQERIQDIPPPFVIEAHSLPEQIQAGQEAMFYMTLIGEYAHSQQMLMQLAWQRALAVGIGSKLTTGQHQSQLLSFQLCDQPELSPSVKSSLQLEIITQARIQHHGRFLNVDSFDAVPFCRSVLRRYLTLLEAYSTVELSEEQISSLYAQVQQVQGLAQLQWKNWSRWSNRQHQKMDMDGLIGTVSLENVTEELFHYLYLGQWLHTGKGCVFGLGQYILRE